MGLTAFQIAIKKKQLKTKLQRSQISQQKYDEQLAEFTEAVSKEQPVKISKPVVAAGIEKKPKAEIISNPEQQSKLEELATQLSDIDREKAQLSNSLQLIPKSQNAKSIVDAIMAKRKEWQDTQDRFYHLKNTGHESKESVKLPENYTAKLPKDKYQIDKLIRNLSSNLSKWKTRMNASKNPTKKQEYEIKIQQGKIELDVLRTHFKAL